MLYKKLFVFFNLLLFSSYVTFSQTNKTLEQQIEEYIQKKGFVTQEYLHKNYMNRSETRFLDNKSVNKVLGKQGTFFSFAIGEENYIKGNSSYIFGKTNNVEGDKSIAIGLDNKINGSDSFIFGSTNSVEGKYSTAIGLNNKLNGSNSVVIGNNITVNKKENNGHDIFVLGANIEINNNIKDAIVLGNKSTAVANALSIGTATDTRKLVFLKEGDISNTSTDAINGSQLYKFAQDPTSLGNDIFNKEKWRKALDITKDDTTSKLEIDMKNLGTIDEEAKKKLIDALSEGADINKPKTKLVTDKQVKDYLDNNYYNKSTVDEKLKEVSEAYKAHDKEVKSALAGVSNAMAVASLPAISGKFGIVASSAVYKKEVAFALGIAGSLYNFNYKLNLNANIRGNVGFGIGMGYDFDKLIKGKSNLSVENKVNKLEMENNELKKVLTDVLNELKELKKTINK